MKRKSQDERLARIVDAVAANGGIEALEMLIDVMEAASTPEFRRNPHTFESLVLSQKAVLL